MRSTTYHTKQQEAIMRYLVSLNGSHCTAAQIIGYFDQAETPIGRTTVYRHLDQLTESGKIRRYTTDGISGACYQLVGDREDCHVHLHLKCEECGELLHLECEAFGQVQQHVLDHHAFQVNALKTVLYGTCESCLRKA